MTEGTSIIICSRNRANALKECLARLPGSTFVAHGVELILIDSASEDETEAVMAAHAAQAKYAVRHLKAPRPGLGLARNLGIKAASGELLVFTDDDCYLQEDYIDQLLRHFDVERYQFCGGRILLWDQSDARVSIDENEEFFLMPAYHFLPAGVIQGANMVVHRCVFDRVGGFDPSLGAGTQLRCEDIELLGRACMNGFSGAHLPELVVYHHHRRKPGQEAAELRLANDIARGAYYACMSDQGFLSYWTEGIKSSLTVDPGYGQNKYQVLINELKGAQLYFEGKSQ